MDKIILSNITAQTIIGIRSFEKSIQQSLSIDLILEVDVARAALHDNIKDTHDYAKIYSEVISFVETHPCHLIETLAEKLADHLKKMFQLSWLQLSITKKPKDMSPISAVAIVVER